MKWGVFQSEGLAGGRRTAGNQAWRPAASAQAGAGHPRRQPLWLGTFLLRLLLVFSLGWGMFRTRIVKRAYTFIFKRSSKPLSRRAAVARGGSGPGPALETSSSKWGPMSCRPRQTVP